MFPTWTQIAVITFAYGVSVYLYCKKIDSIIRDLRERDGQRKKKHA